jgi:hypothetical protein
MRVMTIFVAAFVGVVGIVVGHVFLMGFGSTENKKGAGTSGSLWSSFRW